MKNIIFIAPPAAGKGTMSEVLMDKYGYIHISTGDILREMSKEDDSKAHELKEILSSGKLVSDTIVYEALKRRLLMDDVKMKNFILDGFPRNVEQALEYEKILKETGHNLGVVIYLDTPVDVLEKRITGRRLCTKCGATYNVLTGVNAPKNENTCDKCGGSLYQRDDDNSESFKVRYETFKEKTYPLIKYYEDRKLLYKVISLDVENTIKSIEAIIND